MNALANITIDKALRDPHLLGAALGVSPTWANWIAILRAAFGLPLTEEDRAVFDRVAGGRKPPERRVRELWCIIGRRSGKSRIAAALASYLAAFADHRPKLAPGEAGVLLVLAASKQQANSVFAYIEAFFRASPILAPLIVNTTTDEIRLVGNIIIAVHSNSYRTVRGRTLIAAIFDEAAFWRDDTSSMPDVETYRAVLPALATTGGMLIGISSPYAQRGLLFTKHASDFGNDNSDVLVVQAPTEIFNPTIDPELVAQAHRDDPESAAAEWNAEFRGDLSTFIARAVVEACVPTGVRERPPVRQFRYAAFCDPSGGAHDSMCLGIAHREDFRSVLDVVREIRPPFNPSDVVREFADLMARYWISSVTGDRYGAGWVQDSFRGAGIRYVASERTRSEIYLDALPLLMGRQAELLDDPRLIGQIAQLERRTTRMGRDSVDHMRGAADDVANAALGALTLVSGASWDSRARRDPTRPLPTPKMADPLEMFR